MPIFSYNRKSAILRQNLECGVSGGVNISKDLVVAKDLRASMSDVLRALDELDSRNSPEVRSARKIIQRMLGCDAKTRQAVEKNIHSVLSAINLVLKVDSDTSQIRATMYEILKCLESRYYFAD